MFAPLTIDRHLERWLVAHRFADGLWVWLSRLGSDGAVWIAAGIVLALVRRRAGPAVWVACTWIAADLLSLLLKAAIPRARPRVATLLPRPSTHSFPSGHAATSFACACVLAALEPRLRVPAYILAAAIAFSRLEVGVHFPLDVLAGGVLGLGVGLCVATALRRREAARRRSLPVPPAG